ncbi:YbaB/EbfC family nucleoid-associated protein [Nocardia puris]|uniref:YbaB/EbfC DNA-binding family protein n=1 Tax=Nocardia puris TaxID=208602 RepID=A0A366CU06_9NOCA|nr:YbaB/EbfC family nucleoid-associated protein [Nocardia puris]MBF6370418.1 YbaB/EbfC family nucleoid-associated protein [Nocardia puris]RBO79609.1 YbaB/EbfC DNA-binding family protein [Nocardia puris]
MTDVDDWEARLAHELDDIRASTQQLRAAVAAIRGRADKHGVTVEVDARGDITDLRISPAAMRTSHTQLSTAITDTYRAARADASAKVNRALRSADPRLRAAAEQLKTARSQPNTAPSRPMTEDEIQAADDAFFERRNRDGWTNR